jgi:dTDP-4-dehydrorhamnose 3,5-epimerase
MIVEELPIHEARLFVPRVFGDERGFFKETFSASRYAAAGIAETFVQDNLSVSHAMTLRGLHADRRMAKLVQVLSGRAFDVVVDLRPESPTFLRWHGLELAGNEHAQIYIPAGCLHGFLALEDDTMLAYKQSAEYDPATEFGVAWNDPELAIAWPLEGRAPLLSAKDAANPTLALLRQLGRL